MDLYQGLLFPEASNASGKRSHGHVVVTFWLLVGHGKPCLISILQLLKAPLLEILSGQYTKAMFPRTKSFTSVKIVSLAGISHGPI